MVAFMDPLINGCKSIHPRDVTHVVPRSCYMFASSSKDQDDESDLYLDCVVADDHVPVATGQN